jgi:hypothetical protein
VLKRKQPPLQPAFFATTRYGDFTTNQYYGASMEEEVRGRYILGVLLLCLVFCGVSYPPLTTQTAPGSVIVLPLAERRKETIPQGINRIVVMETVSKSPSDVEVETTYVLEHDVDADKTGAPPPTHLTNQTCGPGADVTWRWTMWSSSRKPPTVESGGFGALTQTNSYTIVEGPGGPVFAALACSGTLRTIADRTFATREDHRLVSAVETIQTIETTFCTVNQGHDPPDFRNGDVNGQIGAAFANADGIALC